MPLPKNLILDHFHLVLVLRVLLQLWILSNILQKDLLYLPALVV